MDSIAVSWTDSRTRERFERRATILQPLFTKAKSKDKGHISRTFDVVFSYWVQSMIRHQLESVKCAKPFLGIEERVPEQSLGTPGKSTRSRTSHGCVRPMYSSEGVLVASARESSHRE